MNCKDFRALLSSYLDGTLSASQKERLELHLQRCETCRAELFDLRASLGELKKLPSDDPGLEFNKAVLAKFEERRVASRPPAPLVFRLAMAAAVLMILTIIAVPVYMYNLDKFVSRQCVYLVGQDSLIPGSRAALRVVVADKDPEHPISGANVTLWLKGSRANVRLMSGKTTDGGTLDGKFNVPDGLSGEYKLVAAVSSSAGRRDVTFPVKLQRTAKVLLTTDKPIYQPGQLIYVRTLSLLRPSLKPASGDKAVLTLEDPKQNRIFQRTLTVDKWGIAATTFQLGEELNLGEYKLTAKLGDVITEKNITVKRYVLPKFKVTLSTDHTYYAPGQVIKGTVTARYFFGKSAHDARVKVNLSALNVNYDKYADITGRTNGEGVFTFEAKAPSFMAGQPIEGGNGQVRITTNVTDTSGHSEETTNTFPVAKGPIQIAVVPENGSLVPFVDNVVYVVTSYPDGRPAKTETELKIGGKTQSASSDLLGVSVFHVTPGDGGLNVVVKATDSIKRVEERLNLYCSRGQGGTFDPAVKNVLLRTDKGIYNVGDSAKIAVLSTKKSGTVYVDAVVDGQTVLTLTASLQNGHAETEIDLSNDYSGTVTFGAYVLSESGVPSRNQAVVLVKPKGNQLKVEMKPDRASYRPGESAHINFGVTDGSGRGVPAAIGVNIVDESVFSVQEQMPGLSALYFALQEEILKPKYQTQFTNQAVEGTLPRWATTDEVVYPKGELNMQKAAKVVFAFASGSSLPSTVAETEEDQRIKTDVAQRNFFDTEHGETMGIFLTALFLIFAAWPWAKACLRRDMLPAVTGVLWLVSLGTLIVSAMVWSMNSPDNGGIWQTTQSVAAYAMVILGLAFLVEWSIRRGWVRGVILLCGFLLIVAVFFPVFSKAREKARFGVDFAGGRRGLAGMKGGPAGMGGPGMHGPLAEKTESLRSLCYLGMSAPDHDDIKIELAGARRKVTSPTHVRDFFPETLYSNPAVITDPAGRARVELRAADSITNWRISALASTTNGEIGSGNAPLKVFQDFFIDLDLPVGVTAGDVVTVPVAVHNYLPKTQKITVSLKSERWFQSKGASTQTLTLGANQVGSAKFPVKFDTLGRHSLTVEGKSDSLSDAIRRDLTVYPNGQEQNVVVNGILSDRAGANVFIPRFAIGGASKLFVKYSPGVFGQAVDGLDALLQVPYGCFEQTTSITYPNVLVLKYLRANKKDRPEISMKAEQYISMGYQRLLTYEVPGGGFDWFGDPPANTILTAYGIMEFADMASVHEVDTRVIDRAKGLLEKRQNPDGSWGSNKMTETWGSLNDPLSMTAYVTWALSEAGFADTHAVRSGLSYLHSHSSRAHDPYTIALCANAYVASHDNSAGEMLDKLAAVAVVRNGRAAWNTRTRTLTYGEGDAASTETIALAAYALVKSGSHGELATQALSELVSRKDRNGSFGTTQATVLALKALLAGSTVGAVGKGEIELTVNGKSAETVHLTGDDSEVTHVVDVTHLLRPGANSIQMSVHGKAQPAYQVVARYYVPWSEVRRPNVGDLTIGVKYGKLRVEKDGLVDVHATVRSNHRKIEMAMVDLGIPPGFTPVADDLEALKGRKIITRYEQTPRQLILYMTGLPKGVPVGIRFRMKALYPVKASVPASHAYDYYNPASTRATSKPVLIESL